MRLSTLSKYIRDGRVGYTGGAELVAYEAADKSVREFRGQTNEGFRSSARPLILLRVLIVKTHPDFLKLCF